MSPVPRWSGLEGRRDETKGKALMGVAEEEETLFEFSQGKKGRKGSKCKMLAEGERHLGGLGQLEHTAL